MPVQTPAAREWEYVNKKGRGSINVQLMCNADLRNVNCVVRWPGSAHDAGILCESAIFRSLQEDSHGYVLGDSA